MTQYIYKVTNPLPNHQRYKNLIGKGYYNEENTSLISMKFRTDYSCNCISEEFDSSELTIVDYFTFDFWNDNKYICKEQTDE